VVRYTAYRRIYAKFSFLTRPRVQNGRILRPSRAMSGSAGLSPSRNRKPEGSTLSVYERNLKKECADLVAGQAVLTAEIKTAYLHSTSSSSHFHGAVPPFQYRRAEPLLTRQTRVPWARDQQLFCFLCVFINLGNVPSRESICPSLSYRPLFGVGADLGAIEGRLECAGRM
jgi:hypothetical protein